MRRTPEQEDARKQRQWETSQHTKCRCGNVAKMGKTQCTRCADATARRESDDNFRFVLDGRTYEMAAGGLCVGDCYYEEDGGEVVYSLARAYARTLT